MNEKKLCKCCERMITHFQTQLNDLKILVNNILKSSEYPQNFISSKRDMSTESLLLQDFQELKIITTPQKNPLHPIQATQHEIQEMKGKINKLEKSIEILPKLKTHVSMLTKIMEYVEEKVDKIANEKRGEEEKMPQQLNAHSQFLFFSNCKNGGHQMSFMENN